jgi:PadR family transcriptional regulator PadR
VCCCVSLKGTVRSGKRNGRPGGSFEQRAGDAAGHAGHAGSANAYYHTIAHVIEHSSEDVLQIEQGSLYPALHRLEDRGWVSSYWGVSENNRKARFYKLTALGRKQLHSQTHRWQTMVEAIGRVLANAGKATE